MYPAFDPDYIDPHEVPFMVKKGDGGLPCHPEDYYDLEDEREADAPPQEPAGPAPPRIRVREKGNTGPKGVIADYKEHMNQKRLIHEAEKRERQDAMRRQGGGVTLAPSAPNEDEQDPDSEGPKEDSVHSDDLDDDFLEAYRKQRIAEMQKYMGPQYGKLYHLLQSDYVSAIDDEPAHTFVVVHITQEMLPPCRRMTKALHAVATEFPHVKFCEINSLEASNNFDDDSLPILIVYRDKEVVEVFVRVTDDLGFAFEAPDVIDLLTRHNVLSG